MVGTIPALELYSQCPKLLTPPCHVELLIEIGRHCLLTPESRLLGEGRSNETGMTWTPLQRASLTFQGQRTPITVITC